MPAPVKKERPVPHEEQSLLQSLREHGFVKGRNSFGAILAILAASAGGTRAFASDIQRVPAHLSPCPARWMHEALSTAEAAAAARGHAASASQRFIPS